MDIAKIRKKLKVSGEAAAGPAEKAQPIAEPESIEQDKGIGAGSRQGEAKASDIKTLPDSSLQVEAPDSIELLTFRLADEEYAFRIEDVSEIIRLQTITLIPKSEAHLLGITSLRGKIIPVVSLKKMLALKEEDAPENKKQKILILKGRKGPIGVLTDRVVGVIRPSLPDIVESPPHLTAEEMRFIEGVAIADGRFISIIRTSEAIAINVV
jgi:purine-binding chemotaxis protein CheW